jgi:Ca2+-dependent lipid-binding protein
MGCCLSEENKSIAYAGYATDLNQKLLLDHKDELDAKGNVKIVIIELKNASGSGFPVKHDIFHSAGPYFELYLHPEDSIAGLQKRRSSHRPKTTEPLWSPPERFQFIVSEESASDILLNCLYFNGTNTPDSIGSAIIHCKDVTPERQAKALKIYSEETGSQIGTVNISVYYMTPDRAASYDEHVVFEYQRWVPVISVLYTLTLTYVK